MNEVATKVDQKADNKQQVIDKIKNSINILVTVGRDPSVDDLSAAIGLTVLLNKLGKHATAIFSGAIPPAITFLEPTKIFESTIDSLRDFIIALDKEKADHLRYKVDGDVVKIFITPYRTTITGDDLEFSQGDYNVELVLALGVENKDHLDASLAAHGQILQDAPVITLSAGTKISELGMIDWHDDNVSGLSEMIANIGEAFKSDKPLLDKQIATALLTGIVAATDRFSNTLTSPRVMTVAAQLMAAGADQQLIASKLQEMHEIQPAPITPEPVEDRGIITEGVPVALKTEQPIPSPNGNLVIDHEPTEKDKKIAEIVANAVKKSDEPESIQPEIKTPEVSEPISTPSIPISNMNPTMPAVSMEKIENTINEPTAEPSMGGILNYTTEQAAEEKQHEIDDQKNKTILSHSYLGSADNAQTNSSLIGGEDEVDEDKNVDIFDKVPEPGTLSEEESNSSITPTNTASTLPPNELSNTSSINSRDSDEARMEIEAALGKAPVVPASMPDLPLPPPIPDFSTLPPSTVPNFNVTPVTPDITTSSSTLSPTDPSQFKIPGQQ